MFIDLVKYNFARDISDRFLGTDLKGMEKIGHEAGVVLDKEVKVAIIKNLKAQHPPISVDAIACLIAAHFISNWVTNLDSIAELKDRILTYGQKTRIPWRYLEYALKILDKSCTLEDIMGGRV
jgi:hypothetical protein